MISSDALSEAEQAPLKEAASALSTLLLEAARTDVDAAGIRSACPGERGEFLQFNPLPFFCSTLLEECKFAPDRTDVFTRIYTVSIATFIGACEEDTELACDPSPSPPPHTHTKPGEQGTFKSVTCKVISKINLNA